MSSELSPISCESCRQKKCKCDRVLPFCTQCNTDPSRCTYPESGKRGLPLGYLTQLEHRLEETEAALFSTLSTLHSINPSFALSDTHIPPDRRENNTKPAKMDEWRRLPLTSRKADLMRWWEEKGGDSSSIRFGESHEGLSGESSSHNLRVEGEYVGLDERQGQDGSASLVLMGDIGGKAEELVKMESAIYF